MRTRYIFLDVDGTLVDFDGTMPESARLALLRAKAAGHKLIISTGRFAAQVYPWLLEAIDFDGCISSSGATVKYGGELVAARRFTREQIARITDIIDREGAIFVCHTDTCMCAAPGSIERATEYFYSCGLKYEQFSSLFAAYTECELTELTTIEKAAYLGARPLEEMRAILGDEYNIDAFSYQNVPSTSGEVNLAGVSKAAGIETLIKHLGVDISDTVAIGDGMNDLDMVRFAGLGVAMGNACDELKSAADYVTDDIAHGGLAKVLDLITEGKL